PHLLKRLVIRAELAFRRLEIVGEHFDGRGVDGGEGGEEPVSELLEQRTAPAVTDPGRLEVAPHRLEKRERQPGPRRGPSVLGRSREHSLAVGDRFNGGRRPAQHPRRPSAPRPPPPPPPPRPQPAAGPPLRRPPLPSRTG